MNFNDFLAAMMGMNSNSDNDSMYDEIRNLDHLLTEANIPHDFGRSMMGGYQITYYGAKGKPEPEPGVVQGRGIGSVCSAIQTPFSYGGKDGRIEISGLLTEEESLENSVAGHLTAEDVFERIRTHWMRENP